jgi:hypothetical protein
MRLKMGVWFTKPNIPSCEMPMKSFFLLWIASAILILTGCDIRRTRELECGLPDRSSFIRKQEYNWSWLSYILPHTTRETNKTAFNTYFRLKEGGVVVDPVAGGPDKIHYQDIEMSKRDCRNFGLTNGVPYFFQIGYMAANGTDLVDVSYLENIDIDIVTSDIISTEIKHDLQSGKLGRGGGAFIVEPSKVTLEYALERRDDPDKPIVAVFHYESLDGGKTWSELRVPSAPKVFELGKSLLQQCFIARPVRVDGKKIKVDFPACPVAFASAGK